MKKWNIWFESILIVLNAILGLLALIESNGNMSGPSSDAPILYFMWLIPLGGLQLLHSFLMGVAYWKMDRVRILLSIYWSLVALNFLFMWIGFETGVVDGIEMLTIVIIPNILAHFLWFITWRQRHTQPLVP